MPYEKELTFLFDNIFLQQGKSRFLPVHPLFFDDSLSGFYDLQPYADKDNLSF